MSMFAKASKEQSKLRLALAGPSGAGKTYTALKIASHLADGGRIAVIDTENGSASKYADLFDFDTASLTTATTFAPEKYLEMLHGAEAAGYSVVVIDSLSHEWAGHGGMLEIVDQIAARMSGNKFNAWGQATPRHDKLVRAIVESPVHIICTLRAKMERVQEKNERGKTEVRVLGLKPIQRDELEYEFDVYGMLDQDHRLVIFKSRCHDLADMVIDKPGTEIANTLKKWLSDGAEPGRPFDAPTAAESGHTRTPANAADSAMYSAPATNATTAQDEPPSDWNGQMDPDDAPAGNPPVAQASLPDEQTPPFEWAYGAITVDQSRAAAQAKCSAKRGDAWQCDKMIVATESYEFAGRSFTGRQIIEASVKTSGHTACPVHAKAWRDWLISTGQIQRGQAA